jgi:pimeloyl-ACP methyl ester carboxylesterase
VAKSETLRPRRGYADGPYGQVHFEALGDGRPLVLLHQAPMTSGQFDMVYEPLARRGVRAIGVDMPGFGLSDPTPDTPTVADYAAVVPAVLDALDLECASLLGHHTGALAATEAAILYPERIERLVINGALLVSEKDRAEFLAKLHPWEKAFGAREHAAHMAELFDIRQRFANGTVPLDRISDYVVQALLGRAPFWWGHHAAYMYDQAPRLALITQPTLLLTNSGDMINAHAHEARRIRPDFEFCELEGGGIDIVDQQSEAWADAVARFATANGE